MKLESEKSAPMLGIIASRKIGNSVVRNWCKRRVREIFRVHQHILDKNGGYLVILRKTMYGREFSNISGDFLYCLHKIEKLKGKY